MRDISKQMVFGKLNVKQELVVGESTSDESVSQTCNLVASVRNETPPRGKEPENTGVRLLEPVK